MASDPGSTPQSDEERKAVKELLKQLRQASQARTDTAIASVLAQIRKDVAHVRVQAPANARVWVNDVPVPAGQRSFNTPRLESGRQYFYTVRAEVVQNGETLAQSQRVVLGAGQEVSVQFTNFEPVTTAQR